VGAQEQEGGRIANGRKDNSKNQPGDQKTRLQTGSGGAPGLAIGGGCEVGLHAAKNSGSAEALLGLVETGVGLIPRRRRHQRNADPRERARSGTGFRLVLLNRNRPRPFPRIEALSLKPCLAKVGASAEECATWDTCAAKTAYHEPSTICVADAKAALALAHGRLQTSRCSGRRRAKTSKSKVSANQSRRRKNCHPLMLRGGLRSE